MDQKVASFVGATFFIAYPTFAAMHAKNTLKSPFLFDKTRQRPIRNIDCSPL